MEKKFNIGRLLANQRYKISDDDFEAVDFIFWMVHYLERLTEDVIIEGQCATGAGRESIQNIVDKLHFGDKISILSDLFKGGKKLDFIKFLWKVNELRNAVAHGRFSKLIYKGQHLSNSEGQQKLFNDYIEFAQGLLPKKG